MEFIRPSPSSICNCFNTKGIKHLTRLRLGLSHLRDHRFKHSFVDSLNPICSFVLDIETTRCYSFHCPNLINERTLLLNDVSRIAKNILPSCYITFVKWQFIWFSDKSSNYECIYWLYLLKSKPHISTLLHWKPFKNDEKCIISS